MFAKNVSFLEYIFAWMHCRESLRESDNGNHTLESRRGRWKEGRRDEGGRRHTELEQNKNIKLANVAPWRANSASSFLWNHNHSHLPRSQLDRIKARTRSRELVL